MAEEVKEEKPKKRVVRKRSTAQGTKTRNTSAKSKTAVANKTIKKNEDAKEEKSKVPKRKTTKRSPRKVVKKDSYTVDEANKKESFSTNDIIESAVVRKAPTGFVEYKENKKIRNRHTYVVGGVLLSGLLMSAIVGFADVGRIDVQETILSRNERIRNNTATNQDTIVTKDEIPVQNAASVANSQRPDGGLIGRGTGGRPKASTAPPVTASSTATTTIENIADDVEVVATSTEMVSTSTETIIEDEAFGDSVIVDEDATSTRLDI